MPANVAASTDVGRTVAAGRQRRTASAALLRARLTAPRAKMVGRPDVGTWVATMLRDGHTEVVHSFPGRHALERWHTLHTAGIGRTADAGRQRRTAAAALLRPTDFAPCVR